MRLAVRLNKAETHPHTEYVHELARLKNQEAKPLFEVAWALQNAHPEDATLRLVEMTDAQLLRLLLDCDLTPQQREEYERDMQTLATLQEQAERNVKLLRGEPI